MPGALLLEGLDRAFGAVVFRAEEYRETMCMGRTHGVHAEPTTFGLKLAGWAFALDRDRERLARAIEGLRVGKLSGAVGTYAAAEPEVERVACERLGLEPAPSSTQILQRDRHAELLSALALLASSLDRFATEIRHLARTEVREVEEPFGRGQKGSSAMPHKRNPITAERICGIARVVRANALVGLENVALWHERDISHSSAERIVLPDSFLAVDYMLDRFAWLVEGLVVREERMGENLASSHGLYFSQRLLLALVESGLSRDDAYRLVQRNAMRAWDEGIDFRGLVDADAEIAGRVDLDAVFDPGAYTAHVDVVFERLRALVSTRREGARAEAVHLASGKVREIYALDDERLLLVASDRISTFDVILPTPIPDKGRVLTGMSAFWFARTREIVPNHLLELRDDGRSTVCRRLEMLPVELVVRGYLSGSGWVDYQASGSVCGHSLPPGLRESDRLPAPIVTPATKAEEGHDLNITEEQAAALCGAEAYAAARERRAPALRVRRGARGGAGNRPRRHEVRVRRRSRRRRHARRRGPHARLVSLLAGRLLQPRRPAAVVRQAVRARLLPRDGMGSHLPRPRDPRRRRGRHEGPLRRGVRAADGDPVRALSLRPEGGSVKATVLIRPKQGILDPQGEAVVEALQHLGFAVSRRPCRPARRRRPRHRGSGGGPRGARPDVARAAREPADRVVHDRAGGRRMRRVSPDDRLKPVAAPATGFSRSSGPSRTP